MKKILAIIPARCGSKGLPDKNIKLLGGKPLIAHSIEAAARCGIFEDIIISTDSLQYADIARKYGATVPFLRSPELASDEAKSSDVIVATIGELRKREKHYDEFILLQPTSPLRTAEDIMNAYKAFVDKNADSVVSVCEVDHPPEWTNILEKNLSLKHFLQYKDTQRQDLGKHYRINGAIYIANVEYYLGTKDFFGERSFAYIMDKMNSVDIDDAFDFALAEMVLTMKERASEISI